MCTDEQHQEKMGMLRAILHELQRAHFSSSDDVIATIADTQPITLDYRNKKHLYLLSSTPLLVKAGTWATVPVAPNVWTSLDYQEGTRLQTVGQASPLQVTLRATDEVIA